ncbi:c-type cytochrome biogenesis protein CcmI [uncultured Thiodictyon sp.]|uniref:c-type cytochrome biogenesis protein CcmI n=1 Tax=uncultured Thiodictyon sp. TaxID=1846217 RepID=UPI0026008BAB|nr:c-type cytochrome biogenesis protein CcmI [uncultured Thiodictyon sp.]
MTIFWILAAGLTALAVLFMLWPLLRTPTAGARPSQGQLNLEVFRRRREELDGDLAAGVLEQAQYDTALKDLERELLHDLAGGPAVAAAPPAGAGRAPILALVLALALPAGAILAYLQLGDPGIIGALAATGGAGDAAAGPADQAPPLDALVQGLAKRLETDPGNVDGWLMLGRTYFAMEQPAKALAAVEHAYQLAPGQANVLVAYAEALAANAGNNLNGRPAELIRSALEREPTNPGARWLDGMLAYQEGRFAAAAQAWQGVLDEIDPAGQDAQQIPEMTQMVAEARRRAGLPAAAAPTPAPAAEPAVPAGDEAANTGALAAGGRIQVTVALAPALAAQAAPDDTVFIFARAANGPPMPLAALRIKAADLPTTVTLDDSMAMMPAMRLSAFPAIVVGARISKRGEATPSPGDLEGQTGPLKASEGPTVAVTVDHVRP